MFLGLVFHGKILLLQTELNKVLLFALVELLIVLKRLSNGCHTGFHYLDGSVSIAPIAGILCFIAGEYNMLIDAKNSTFCRPFFALC